MSNAFAKSIIRMSVCWTSRIAERSSMNSTNWVLHDMTFLNPWCRGYNIRLFSPCFVMLRLICNQPVLSLVVSALMV